MTINQFHKYKKGMVIGYGGAAYMIYLAERRMLKAVNMSSQSITIKLTPDDEPPLILAETGLDYILNSIKRNF